jgi:hypothetical protein
MRTAIATPDANASIAATRTVLAVMASILSTRLGDNSTLDGRQQAQEASGGQRPGARRSRNVTLTCGFGSGRGRF